ncbi:hypothetical protein C8J57DRAFT_1569185 [Mycena rebaudengoi]|nr:hypothetical protein C8J57DRAFT_1569185 [Mycena rebaudengoi]
MCGWWRWLWLCGTSRISFLFGTIKNIGLRYNSCWRSGEKNFQPWSPSQSGWSRSDAHFTEEELERLLNNSSDSESASYCRAPDDPEVTPSSNSGRSTLTGDPEPEPVKDVDVDSDSTRDDSDTSEETDTDADSAELKERAAYRHRRLQEEIWMKKEVEQQERQKKREEVASDPEATVSETDTEAGSEEMKQRSEWVQRRWQDLIRQKKESKRQERNKRKRYTDPEALDPQDTDTDSEMKERIEHKKWKERRSREATWLKKDEAQRKRRKKRRRERYQEKEKKRMEGLAVAVDTTSSSN